MQNCLLVKKHLKEKFEHYKRKCYLFATELLLELKIELNLARVYELIVKPNSMGHARYLCQKY